MRYVFLFLVLLQTLSAGPARAQDVESLPRGRAAARLAAPSALPRSSPLEHAQGFAPYRIAAEPRDRSRGALWGLAAGALAGGAGFAAVTWAANRGEAGEDYWPLALVVGSAVGGAVGLVAGALIGAPERQSESSVRTSLLVLPTADRTTQVGVSVAF
ncbi:hypothetical protein [Longimicrobium sp.]|jgi:hypothetical protein|uniref:hypothetical protein n=1 Tax=Longimicrobium sp. TaxID=2029185 RepID=UPI002EDB7773